MSSSTTEERVAYLEAFLESELGFKTQQEGNVQRVVNSMSKELTELDEIVNGTSERMGMKTRVMIIWHSASWLWGVVGVVVGWAVHMLWPN